MTVQSIWKEEIQVRAHEADLLTYWKPAAFFQAMQEAASHHASHFGYHYIDMLEHDMIWILSRVKIYFYNFPIIGENITIRTWPKGLQQKVFFMRDFEFIGKSGECIAAASSAWVLLNPKVRRMLLPQALYGTIPDNDGLYAFDELLERIPEPKEKEESLRVKSGYSAVDMMNHTNNARYIEWICDSFPIEKYQTEQIQWLQINFVNEVKPGELIAVYKGQKEGHPDVQLVEGKNLTNGLRAFEAELKWGIRSK